VYEKILVIFSVIVFVLIGGFFLFTYIPETQETPENLETNGEKNIEELVSFFGERLTTLGVQRLGAHPIEGFDAFLLINAFPGFEIEDFEEVESFEGHYEVVGGELTYIRDQDQPITSAEQTVSSEGYVTLLKNVSKRLQILITSTQSVDALISELTKDSNIEIIETKINQDASALDVKVIPLEVLEDSRCASDVECIQAGTVRLRAQMTSGLGEATEVFELGKFIMTEAEKITLQDVKPLPVSTETIEPSEYVFVFRIEKLSSF
jgi:hypothetical protein